MDEEKRKRRVRRKKPIAASQPGYSSYKRSYPFEEQKKKDVARRGDFIEDAPRPLSKKEAHRRRKKAAQIRILSVFIFILFLVYICFYIGFSMNKEKLSETKIVLGSIERPAVFNGIIIRDEKVYKSDTGGVAVFSVPDGDRVKKGTLVCGIQDKETVKSLEDSLSDINESILSIQKSRLDFSIYEGDIKDANIQIKKIIDDEGYKSTLTDISQIYHLKDKIQQRINMRNQMLLNEDKGSLVGLVQEKAATEDKIAAAVSNMIAEESGIVAYYVDGFENDLTMESLYNLSKEQTQNDADADYTGFNYDVSAGGDVFKVVKSNNWYIAAYLPENEAAGWTENSAQTLYIQTGNDFEPYEAVVDKIIPVVEKDEVYIVFKCNTLLTKYLDRRSISFKTNIGINEGFKIPNAAIADRTLLKIPNKYVFDTSKGLAVMKHVDEEIIETVITSTSSDEEFTYVLQDLGILKLSDKLSAKDNASDIFIISEVRNARGVYVINTGIMVFKELNFESGIASNNSYTIVDPALNGSIKNQDRIIADVKTLTSTKKVY